MTLWQGDVGGVVLCPKCEVLSEGDYHQEVVYHVHDCLWDSFASLDHNWEMFWSDKVSPDSLSSTIQKYFFILVFIFHSHLTLLHVGSCVANTQ